MTRPTSRGNPPRLAKTHTHWESGDPQDDITPDVVVDLVGSGDDARIRLDLSDLAARRLVLALGVNTIRHGAEVRDILTGINLLLFGAIGSEETASPLRHELDAIKDRLGTVERNLEALGALAAHLSMEKT